MVVIEGVGIYPERGAKGAALTVESSCPHVVVLPANPNCHKPATGQSRNARCSGIEYFAQQECITFWHPCRAIQSRIRLEAKAGIDPSHHVATVFQDCCSRRPLVVQGVGIDLDLTATSRTVRKEALREDAGFGTVLLI